MAYKENRLPYPFVHWSFVFYGFSNKQTSSIYLCECAKEALKNLRSHYEHNIKKNPSFYNANWRANEIPSELQLENENFIESYDKFQFRTNICHYCNKLIPAPEHAHGDIHQSNFFQRFGGYIQQRKWHYNVFTNNTSEILHPEIKEIINIDREEFIMYHQCWYHKDEKFPHNYFIKKYSLVIDSNSFYGDPNDIRHNMTMKTVTKMFSLINKENRRINKIVENEVRTNFGYKLIGQKFVNETTLFMLICKSYPDIKVIHHARPEHLTGQEYDIFIPEFQLAIEYQGIQHFKPIKVWGGKKGLELTKRRDHDKKIKANGVGVKIIYFNYNDEITEDFIVSKLSSYLC